MIDAVLKFWPIVLVFLQFFTMWVGWSLRKEFVTHTDLAKAVSNAIQSANHGDTSIHGDIKALRSDHEILHDKVTEGIDKRLLRVEEGIKHMPKHEDLSRIHQRMDELNSLVQKIDGTSSSTNRTVGLIQQHLLNGGKQ